MRNTRLALINVLCTNVFISCLSLDFDAMDQRWIGAWWLGFIVSIVVFLIIAVPLFGYPKYLPGKLKYGKVSVVVSVCV